MRNRPVDYPPMIAKAVRTVRNFWQMVAVLAALVGVLFGAVTVRYWASQLKDYPLVSPCVARMVQGKPVDNAVD